MRIKLIGVAIVLCLALLIGCDKGIIEDETQDMIALQTWYFTSGMPNNTIFVKHTDKTVVFEVTADDGNIWYDNQSSSTHIVKPDSVLHWDPIVGTPPLIENAFIEIILKKDDHIIGYAVIGITKESETFDYNAEVLKSILFPQVNGQYQDISEEYIKETIEKVKEN